MLMNLYIVLGIWLFFLIDRLTHELLGGDCHSHSQTEAEAEKQLRFKKFAVISMIGDFVHNFTDGLSIGVSYLVDYKMGLVTTMAMFFHEIPHEVGDFAILIQLDYRLWQIVLVQCLTGGGALCGSVVGYYVGQAYQQECLAITTGGFLYFSINGLMGELKEVKSVVGLFFVLFVHVTRPLLHVRLCSLRVIPYQ